MQNEQDWQMTLQSAMFYGYKSGVKVIAGKRETVELVRNDIKVMVPLRDAIREIDKLSQRPENRVIAK